MANYFFWKVPGVKGIGPKKATELLKNYGSVDNLLKNLEKLSPKERKALLESKEILHISKKLVTLAQDVPVSQSVQEFRFESIDKQRVSTFEIFSDLLFF